MILVDTSVLVGLCDRRDGLHARALQDLDRVGRRPMATCDSVLTEACFLLDHPIQRQRLARLLDQLPIRAVDSDGESLHGPIFVWLWQYRDHSPDWADAHLVTLLTRTRGSKIWTYDREFSTVWRKLDGKRIPLFVDPAG